MQFKIYLYVVLTYLKNLSIVHLNYLGNLGKVSYEEEVCNFKGYATSYIYYISVKIYGIYYIHYFKQQIGQFRSISFTMCIFAGFK